jgi:hypothetical protein
MIEQQAINLFLHSDRQLRSGWWVVIFFLVLAAILTLILFLAQRSGSEASIGLQALILLYQWKQKYGT